MKERFLNIFLFLGSILFMVTGAILIFFQSMNIITPLATTIGTALSLPDGTTLNFLIAFIGSFVFGWGMFFFFLTVFAVMELKHSSIYGFIFWGYTFWAAAVAAGIVVHIGISIPLFIIFGALYGVVFVPFFLSLPMKKKQSAPPQE